MNAEPSTVSKSASESASMVDQKGHQIAKGFETIFSFYDSMLQFSQFPNVIYQVFLLWYFFQNIFVSFWATNASFWSSSKGNSDIVTNFLHYFTAIFMFQPIDTKFTSTFIALVVITVVVIASIVGQLICFKVTRRFVKGTLKFTRVLIELVTLVVMHPLAFLFSRIILEVIANLDFSVGTICYAVFSFIFFVIIIVLFACNYTLISPSPYLGINQLSAFSLDAFIYLGMLNPIFLIVSMIFSHFYEWMVIIVYVLHVLFNAYYLVLMMQRPFTHLSTNVIFFAVGSIQILLDIVNFILKAFNTIDGVIFIGLIAAFIVISLIIGYVSYYLQGNFLTKRLKYWNDEDNQVDRMFGQDDNRKTTLEGLNIERSKYNSVLYMNFCVQSRNPMNLDFYMLKYLLTHQTDSSILMHCMKIVSFFPMESRLLNSIAAEGLKRRDLNVGHKFLLYELNHIRIIRQSSSSVAAADRLRELSAATKEVHNEVISFWEHLNVSFSFLTKLKENVKKMKSLWEEALQEYPNSAQHSEEYCYFLIDSATDFIGAIKQRHRADLIESGRNFSIDRCFRFFIGNFPDYLKKGIVDANGVILATKAKRKGSASTSSAKDWSHSGSSLSSMDMAVEEGIAKSLISHARMRIALQQATNTKKANGSFCFLIVSIWSLLMMLFSSLFVFVFFFSYFDTRLSAALRIQKSNEIRSAFFASTFCLMINIMTELGLYDDTNFKKEIGHSDDDIAYGPYFPIGINWTMLAMGLNIKARNSYSEFLINIADYALNSQMNIYEITGPLLDQEKTFMIFCKNGAPLKPQYENLQTALSYQFVSQTMIAGNTNYSYWFSDNDEFCSIMKTNEYLSASFDNLRHSLSIVSEIDFENAKKVIEIITFILPAANFILTFIPFIISIVMIYLEMIKFLRMMQSFDPEVKREAAMSLRKNSEYEPVKRAENSTRDSNLTVLFGFLFGFLMAFFSVFLFIQLYFIVRDNNQKFEYSNTWLINAVQCRSLTFELLVLSTEIIAITNSSVFTSTKIATTQSLELIISNLTTALLESIAIVTEDSDEIPSAFGYDSTLDSILQKDQCEVNKSDTSLHELYRCTSVEHMLTLLGDLVKEMLVKVNLYKGKMDQTVPLNIVHSVNYHIVPLLLQVENRFVSLSNNFLSKYKTLMGVFFAILLIVSFFLFIMMLILLNYYNSCFMAAMILLRRVSPVAIVAKTDLIQYLLDRSSAHSSQEMTTARSVIYNSSDCILCISLTGVIETINPSVTNLLGYTPEQLLGQTIMVLFDDDDKPRVLSQMTLIKNRQSAPNFEDHIVTISDDDTRTPCNLTILGMVNDDTVKSFVFILRDEKDLLKQQQDAENAKKQSEQLLYQILPHNIVLRINQGEKDISFSVPSATIMFIDIVKFSEYASTLTPKEIMVNLSMIFGAYDEILSSFSTLLKIKLIGDVYMCAGGLFDPDIPPATHAEQMIKFAFEALQIIEDTNMKLNALLSVRIGVNTGGPLIAGVLGTDKPVFDIIGDPINIASRLQSTDIPGNVQVSQDTHDLIADNEAFAVEPRGEIFLKGKGKTNSFLVRPQKNLQSHSDSCSFASFTQENTTSIKSFKDINLSVENV